MKYRTKSANVLNEADRAERILNHQLFTIEQDNMLFNGSYDEWRPGDPMYPHPRGDYSVCDTPGCGVNPDGSALALRYDDVRLRECNHERYQYWINPAPANYEGNCTRNMYDLFDDGSAAHHHSRCQKCDVDWRGNTPCWNCDEWPRPLGPHPAPVELHYGVRGMRWDRAGERTYESGVDRGVLYVPSEEGHRAYPWHGLTTITEGPSGLEDDVSFNQFSLGIEMRYDIEGFSRAARRAGDSLREMQEAFMRSMLFSPNEMRSLLGIPPIQTDEDLWREANPSWGGPRPHFVLMDEGRTMMLNPNPVVRYEPPVNPFEREMPERIVTASISESAAEPLEENPVHPPNSVWRRARRTSLQLPTVAPEVLQSRRPPIPEYYIPQPGPVREFPQFGDREFPTSNHIHRRS